jgi:glycosyltransferase involved in cell wall biosynthesis
LTYESFEIILQWLRFFAAASGWREDEACRRPLCQARRAWRPATRIFRDSVNAERTVISIAMATYNGERFLEEQLSSLNAQDRLPNELVVCDDGSTDQTSEILAQFAKRASFPVRLFNNGQQLGWRANFLKAASLCTSEYIAFCDQDDIWLREKLSVVSRYLEGGRCIVLQHGYRLIDDDGNLISGDIKYSRGDREALWRINFGFSQVFHRSLLKFSNLWELSIDAYAVDIVAEPRMGHDNWIAFLGSLFGEPLVIDDALVYYRQHKKNAIGFAEPVSAISVKYNLSTILSRFYGGGDEFQKKRQRMIRVIQGRAMAAIARERIIELIIPQVSDEQVRSLRVHLQYYSELGQYQSQRLVAYLSQSRAERLQAAFRNFRQGLYQAQGRRGAREAIADIVYGVAS